MNADATQAGHVHVASQPATLSALTDGNDRDLAYRDIVEAFSQTLTARLYNHGATPFETRAAASRAGRPAPMFRSRSRGATCRATSQTTSTEAAASRAT